MRNFHHTLVGRLALMQLAIHLVLPPVLYYRLETMLRDSASQTFISHAHAYAHALTHELEVADVLQSPARTVVFLDAIVQGGGCSYAAIDYRGRIVGSSVAETPDWIRRRGSDHGFGESGDGIYAESEQFVKSGMPGTIYFGFDKRATVDQLRDARYQIVLALVIYATASVAAAWIFARLVSRPLTQLQRASRRAAMGDPAERLGTDSSMVEIVNLANDLEYMRGELVGSAALLRREISERERERVRRLILEDRLRHEQRLATIGTFAGGLAHELNNTILPMLLYSGLALDDIPTEHPARGNVEQTLRAAVRASDVISKVLAFSRPPEKQRDEPFDPAAVVTESLGLFGTLIPANIKLRTDVRSQGECILGDPTLLNQVMLNLLSNAVHALRPDGGSLEISLAFTDNGHTEESRTVKVAELRVKDSGKGMTPETLERIFEPFFTTREVGEGTGLGLSVVHGIVTGMGGSISVSSEIGIGTEFLVVLPVAVETAPVV